MSVYIIDKCERFVSQRAGCGKAARPEFCEGCTTIRGAPTRPMRYVDLSDVLNQKNSGSVAAIFMSCNLGILQYFTIFYIKNYFMSFF